MIMIEEFNKIEQFFVEFPKYLQIIYQIPKEYWNNTDIDQCINELENRFKSICNNVKVIVNITPYSNAQKISIFYILNEAIDDKVCFKEIL